MPLKRTPTPTKRPRRPLPERPSELFEMLEWQERGLLHRLCDLSEGLLAPKGSLENKEARQEALRLLAPVAALLVPMAIIALLCLLTARPSSLPEQALVADLLGPDPPETRPELIELPPPEEILAFAEPSMPDLSDVLDPNLAGEVVEQPIVVPPLSALQTPRVPSLPGVAIRRGGGGGGLGGRGGVASDLRGSFINLARTSNNRPRHVDFYADLKALLSQGLTKHALAPYATLSERLYLSHLVLPYAKSSLGPTSFHAERFIRRGSPWAIVYRGRLQPDHAGVFRFVGLYDDVMVVRVNGRTVFEFTWPTRNLRTGEQTALRTGWSPSDPGVTGHYCLPAFNDAPLTFGDWVSLDPARPATVEILLADAGGDRENDGGFTGGLLLIQERNQEYIHAPDGTPLLPPFVSTRLSLSERLRLARICDTTNTALDLCPFTLESIPIMNTAGQPQPRPSFQDAREIRIEAGDL